MATLNGQSAQAPVLPEVIATKVSIRPSILVTEDSCTDAWGKTFTNIGMQRRELLQACKIAASQSSKSLEEITTSARKRQKVLPFR